MPTYLKAILGFVGVTNIAFLKAGSTWNLDRGLENRARYLEGFKDHIQALAGGALSPEYTGAAS